jgi:PAS domain S-box-containing protein
MNFRPLVPRPDLLLVASGAAATIVAALTLPGAGPLPAVPDGVRGALAAAPLALGLAGGWLLARARTRSATASAELEQRVRERADSLAAEIAQRRQIEADLRRTRDGLQLALEGSNTSCWELDVASNQVALDRRWSAMRGGPARETTVSGRALLALVHPEDRRRLLDQVEACRAPGCDRYSIEHRVRRGDGGWMWVLSQGRVIARDDQGAAARIIGTNTDITAHKAADEAREREREFLAALNEATLELVQPRAQAELLQGIADHARRLLRVSEVELVLSDAAAPPARAPRDAATTKASVAAGALAARHAEVRAQRTPFVSRPGAGDPALAVFPILHGAHCLGTLALRRAAGEGFTAQELEHGGALSRMAALVLHVSAAYHDAVRRADAHTRELAENEARFRGVFHQSPIPILLTSVPEARIVEANAASLALFGYAREEIIGRSTDELGIWVEPKDRAEYFQRLAAAGVVRGFETRMATKSGAILDMFCTGTVLMLGGRPWVLSSAIDVTAQKQAEAARVRLEQSLRQAQKMESLGTLAGGIAHDFNNVLTGIFGFAELARMELPPDHSAQAWLAQIGTTGLRAKELVRQILTFSRRNDAERRAQRLQPVVEEALRLLRSTLPAMVELERAIAPDAPPARIDATQVHQIVLNLCTNAWHALPPGGGRIAVSLDACELAAPAALTHGELRAGRYVRLRVADDGCGMSPAVAERAFEPFFTTKEAGKGSGLGLSVVHGIMQAHGGAIALQTAVNAGSTFTLYFPALGAAELLPDPAVAPLAPAAGELIYLVDDDPDSGLALEKLAQSLGYKVRRFSRPEELLREFRAAPGRCDAVLTDLAMPGIPGDVVARELLRVRPRLPVFVITGLIESTQERQLREQGVAAVIRKPVERHELGRQLSAIAPRRAAERTVATI